MIEKVVAGVFEMNERDVKDDLTPESVERWDSLTHLRLITALEEAFGIKLSMREVLDLTSVAAVRQTVDRHLREKSPAS